MQSLTFLNILALSLSKVLQDGLAYFVVVLEVVDVLSCLRVLIILKRRCCVCNAVRIWVQPYTFIQVIVIHDCPHLRPVTFIEGVPGVASLRHRYLPSATLLVSARVQLQDLHRCIVKGALMLSCDIPSSYILSTSGLKIQYPDVACNSYVLFVSPRASGRRYASVLAE